MDGTKLPLFVIFKSTPHGFIEKRFPDLLPGRAFMDVYSVMQWCDERSMGLWYENVWKKHIEDYSGESGLILDDYSVHKMDSLLARMTADNTLRFLIPGNYTSVLQPCDVGVNKTLKDRLKSLHLIGGENVLLI